MKNWLLFTCLCLLSLASCAPKGAKNWPFSIGPRTYTVALGDLDGDGDLDAFLANGENEVPVPNTVWINDGSGTFHDSGQLIGGGESRYVILEDLDVDGNPDALVGNTFSLSVYMNDGQGKFANASQKLGQESMSSYLLAPAVGDVNGDGFPDVVGGGCCGGVQLWDDGRRVAESSFDSLWLNDGGLQNGKPGVFTDSNQRFDIYGTVAVVLGDLDGDGDMDAVFANSASQVDQTGNMDRNQPDTIWINDGGSQGGEEGLFTMSAQLLGNSEATTVALGDLDGDGDLDLLVGTGEQDEIWLNDGGKQGGQAGSFSFNSWLDGPDTRAVSLVDLDGDGDLDALVVGKDIAVIWWNDGAAGFTIGPGFEFEPQHALAAGDLNGDGWVDIFAGSVNHGLRIWFNDGQGSFAEDQ